MSANVAILYKFVNVFAYSHPKEVHLIKEYVLFVPACPWKLCDLINIVKAKDLVLLWLQRTYLHLYYFEHSFMMNLLLPEAHVVCLQYASCC